MNKIIFWNVAKKANLKLILDLCEERTPDVLVLAEIDGVSSKDILRSINSFSGRIYYEVNPLGERVKIFSIFNSGSIFPVIDSGNFSAVIVSPPLGPRYLMVAVHLPSKMHISEVGQLVLAQRISSRIADLESLHDIQDTVVLGDFNMNPFEPGMVNSDGFHAVMDRRICENSASRTVQGEDKSFFYNPMWGLSGDTGPGPAGSYFYRVAEPICYFWNLFDQAIFRPSLIKFLNGNPVVIVDKIADADLLYNGRPDRKISDHLPIMACFKSTNEV